MSYVEFPEQEVKWEPMLEQHSNLRGTSVPQNCHYERKWSFLNPGAESVSDGVLMDKKMHGDIAAASETGRGSNSLHHLPTRQIKRSRTSDRARLPRPDDVSVSRLTARNLWFLRSVS
ncbi:hypothetical protein BaRGS_00006920 [Batillaria attramentaria]|uniref:Uncharacterized protein n=1 Tax=Batillaria attramentaria TaxID=370345 RepID=A0ABD0LS34_9CAEN